MMQAAPQAAGPPLCSRLMSQLDDTEAKIGEGELRGGRTSLDSNLCPSPGTKSNGGHGPQDTGLSPQMLQNPPGGQTKSLLPFPSTPVQTAFWTLIET